MINQLAKVKIEGKVYYQDDRLREYRQVTNPHQRIRFDDIGDRKIELIEAKKQLSNKPKLR
jgi:hypothetical protein